ncbi:MAG: AAA family ATPase, partial [Planctomycetaceae bacterium]
RAFDIPYRLDVASLGNAVTGDLLAITLASQDGTCVAPADVGFGISQLLPILVEGRVAERQTLCVEQPEIHLHPRLQARLADFFIQSAGLLPSLQAAGRRPVPFPRDPDIIAAYASQYGVP